MTLEEKELSKGFTGIEINGVRFSNIREMLIYMNKQRDKIANLKKRIEKMINEIDKTMIISNMREREIYDIQEIFRKYNFRRDSNDKWELKE